MFGCMWIRFLAMTWLLGVRLLSILIRLVWWVLRAMNIRRVPLLLLVWKMKPWLWTVRIVTLGTISVLCLPVEIESATSTFGPSCCLVPGILVWIAIVWAIGLTCELTEAMWLVKLLLGYVVARVPTARLIVSVDRKCLGRAKLIPTGLRLLRAATMAFGAIRAFGSIVWKLSMFVKGVATMWLLSCVWTVLMCVRVALWVVCRRLRIVLEMACRPESLSRCRQSCEVLLQVVRVLVSVVALVCLERLVSMVLVEILRLLLKPMWIMALAIPVATAIDLPVCVAFSVRTELDYGRCLVGMIMIGIGCLFGLLGLLFALVLL